MVANWSNWIKKHSEACQHWKIVAKLPSLLPWGISGQSSRPVGSSSIATWNRWLDWLQNKVAQLHKTAMSRYSLEFWRNSTSLTKGIWGTSQEVRQAYCSWLNASRELLCLHPSLLRILRYDLECDGVKFKSHQVTSTYIKLPYHPIDSHPILIHIIQHLHAQSPSHESQTRNRRDIPSKSWHLLLRPDTTHHVPKGSKMF